MFVDKARSGALERSSTWVGSGLTKKHYTRLERLAWDKHFSLFSLFASYKEKKVL
jgi:hypothetical protein